MVSQLVVALANTNLLPFPPNPTQFLLGIDILGRQVDLNTGLFFDLPYVSASVSQVSDATKTCQPPSNSSLSTPSHPTQWETLPWCTH